MSENIHGSNLVRIFKEFVISLIIWNIILTYEPESRYGATFQVDKIMIPVHIHGINQPLVGNNRTFWSGTAFWVLFLHNVEITFLLFKEENLRIDLM